MKPFDERGFLTLRTCKGLMKKGIRELIEKAATVLRDAGATEVYLFGSASGGELRKGSDIDLAVAGLPPERFFEAMGQAADILQCRLDLVDLDEESPFTRYLREEGELLRVG